MHRIDTTNKATDLFGAGKHGWRNGNKALGINATEFNAEFQNTIQEELAAIAEAAGLTLNPNNNAQVLEAIQALIEARAGDYSLDTGTANAKVIALNPAINAYTGNFSGSYKNAVTNTGACTLNSGGGAKALVNDVGGALINGDLPAGAIVNYQYILADDKFYVTSVITSQQLTQAAADARYDALGAANGLFAAPHDVTSSRALGGSGYTNNTGKPMVVFAKVRQTGNSDVQITVGGILSAHGWAGYNAGSPMEAGATAMVPAGATYIITSASTGGTLQAVTETY